ncbi:MAG: phage major capsid protein [Clostridia bacterium]|nr:phage major capsid protein [Clostridia bacterium]
MALKVLMLRARLNARNADMTALQQTRETLRQRSAELESDINEAATEEELNVCDQAVSDLDTQITENDAAIDTLQAEIDDITRQIAELEAAQERGNDQADPAPAAENERRNDPMPYNATADRRWFGLSYEERDRIMQRDDVKNFAAQLRAMRGQTRAVTNADLGIPTVLLGLLENNFERYSKLVSHITVHTVKGTGRLNIAGTVPEAFWVEATAAVSELTLSFTNLELDGAKVCGYAAIPNATLEDDDDLRLITTVMEMIFKAMGLAFDKAVIFGTGTNMPVGFVTRLAAATQPAWWGTKQGTFTDLSATHVLKLNLLAKVGAEFFQPLLAALGVADPAYSDGKPVWVMNRKTHIDLLTRCLAFDMNAALLAGMNNTMPVIGGEIIEEECMSDYNIAGGYSSLMIGLHRTGAKVSYSDLPMFIQDQTVFKGTDRWDAKPARGEGFVVVSYNNVNPVTTATFAGVTPPSGT